MGTVSRVLRPRTGVPIRRLGASFRVTELEGFPGRGVCVYNRALGTPELVYHGTRGVCVCL